MFLATNSEGMKLRSVERKRDQADVTESKTIALRYDTITVQEAEYTVQEASLRIVIILYLRELNMISALGCKMLHFIEEIPWLVSQLI
jgi:hypothetical protein